MCLVAQLCLNSLQPNGLQPAKLPCPWGFSRQEYQSGLPCPSQGDLPNPGIEPRSPTLQANSLLSEPPGKPEYRGIEKTKIRNVITSEGAEESICDGVKTGSLNCVDNVLFLKLGVDIQICYYSSELFYIQNIKQYMLKISNLKILVGNVRKNSTKM